MAFFYVKTGGTATGDAGRATSQRTGSFASMGAAAYYASITGAIAATTPPVAGDFIFCSDAHSGSVATLSVPASINIVSVADTNCDQYSAGASESGGANNAFYNCAAGGVNSFTGMTLTGGNSGLFLRSAAGGTLIVNGGVLNAGGSGDMIFSDVSGGTLEINDADLIFQNSPAMRLGQNSRTVFRGCFSTGTARAKLCSALADGCSLEFYDTDVSQLLTANIFDDVSTSVGRYALKMRRCKLPASFAAFDATPLIASYEIDIAACSNPATPDHNAYHYFYYASPLGEVEEDITTYLSATYDGSNGFSALFSSGAKCTRHAPLRYLLGVIPAQDLTSAKTITVDVTSDAGLTDNDIWIEVVRPDSTDNALGKIGSTQNADLVAPGSALPTVGAGTWTNADAASYLISYDIGALANINNGNVAVYGCVGKASIFANFDMPSIGAT